MPSPFDDPEASQLFKDLLTSLTVESHRGAVLIGAAHIDNCLRSLFDTTFPAPLSKQERRQLLKYPGPLSSFSARTEIAYGTRLISRDIYDALNALRRLRNDVAHSPHSFTLVGQQGRYQPIFAVGPAVPAGVRKLAFDMMMEVKTTAIIEALQELQEEDPETQVTIRTKDDAIAYVSQHPDIMTTLEGQLPQWELAIGIALLGSLIIRHRQAAAKVLGTDLTISQLSKRIEQSAPGVQDATNQDVAT